VYIDTIDGQKINAWFIPAKDEALFTVLFSHGNGGNISHRMDKIIILHRLGLNVFIYDYRGYGKSRGRPSEEGIYLDAIAAYNYLVKERGSNENSILLYGESLGGVVSVDLASKVKTRALVLEGIFSSAKDMASEIYPFLPTIFLKSKFDSMAKIKKITMPKLFIHSLDDEIVPVDLSKKLFNVAPEPKLFVTLKGGHNTCFADSQDDFLNSITSFIDKLKEIR
jgi:fermentation-respiration switch protein FrsA (DUF1100 family)